MNGGFGAKSVRNVLAEHGIEVTPQQTEHSHALEHLSKYYDSHLNSEAHHKFRQDVIDRVNANENVDLHKFHEILRELSEPSLSLFQAISSLSVMKMFYPKEEKISRIKIFDNDEQKELYQDWIRALEMMASMGEPITFDSQNVILERVTEWKRKVNELEKISNFIIHKIEIGEISVSPPDDNSIRKAFTQFLQKELTDFDISVYITLITLFVHQKRKD